LSSRTGSSSHRVLRTSRYRQSGGKGPGILITREYWRIYGGPGFFTVLWFGSSPAPFPLTPVSKFSIFLSLPVCRRSSLLMSCRGGEGVGEEPNHTTARNSGSL
jgi:hypothetical protein